MPTTKRTPSQAKQDLERRRAASAARRAEERDILSTAVEARRTRDMLDALERILLRGPVIRLDTLADLLLPQPWVLDDEGRIAGHVLTVDDEVLLQAGDQDTFEVLALPDALTQPWAHLEERVLWGQAYAEALRALADQAEGATRAAQDADALRRLLSHP